MEKKELSYQEAIQEVEEILQQIEKEELDVDELTTRVKRASVLLKICKDKLRTTENEVEKIIGDIDTEVE